MNGFIIILFLLLIIETICFISYANKKAPEFTAAKQQEEESKKRLYEIQKEINELSQQKAKLLQEITDKKQEAEDLYENEKNKLSEQINLYKSNTSYASEQYIDTLEQQYDIIEKEHDAKVKELAKEEEKSQALLQDYENKINDLKETLNAGARAQMRERQLEQEQSFYKLSVSQADLDDITKLENIKLSLHQPVVLSKLIWTTYFQKQTTDMCNRILGTDKVCGIYKITDLKTQQCYIGQSVDVSQRWKDHVKCGLGIDASSTNKLYNAMQRDGVWNFTFELLESCDKAQLDEKEAFWISMFEANELGLNSTRGNGR